MGLSEGTRETLRDLRLIGTEHGRRPSPAADDEPDLLEATLGHGADAAILELPGVPSITVHVDGSLEDTVVVEDVISFDIPRRDTVALVQAVLAGRARLRRDDGGRWSALRIMLLAPFLRYLVPFTNVLVVPIPGRTPYEQPVPVQLFAGGWLSSVPAEP